MNLWRKIESVVKPWMMVVIFILLLLWGFSKEARADEVVSVEIGGTMLSGEYSDGAMLLINTTFDDKWRVGMGYVSEQEVTDRHDNFHEVRENLFIHGQRLVSMTDKLDFGVGVGYFNAITRWNGSKFVASLSVEYDISDNWGFSYRHFSNAGSATPNMGQDAFLISYSFQ